jgi:TonB family protein
MFTELNSGSTVRRRVLSVSLAGHAVLFVWLLHPSSPQLLNPSSVALGRNGHVLTTLYFPTQSPDESSSSSSDQARQVFRHQRLNHEKPLLKKDAAVARLALPTVSLAPNSSADEAKTTTLSKDGHGAPAGPIYGSMPGGPIYGNEIRPALPVFTADPVVYPWELPESEGNVVVEITIDERGTVIRKTVLHSMGPKLDDKFLAALENWRFQPATRNGMAIASKQDAVFHFRARA